MDLAVINFDEIHVHFPDNEILFLTPSDFFSLPVGEKVKIILSGNLTFYERGTAVNRREALVALRKFKIKD